MIAPAPAPPAAWNIDLRYQIIAFRTERLRQYAEMAAVLKAAGFEPQTASSVSSGLGQKQTVNFTLKLPAAKGEVTVSGEAPLVNPENPNTSTTLNAPALENLPNPGADMTYPLQFAPGALMNTAGSGNDVMTGGKGNDVYYVQNAKDKVTEAAGKDRDLVFVEIANYTLAANIEIGKLSLGGVNLVGNALGNGRWFDSYLCGLVPKSYAPSVVPSSGCQPPVPAGGK